jgi:hypothetical protein
MNIEISAATMRPALRKLFRTPKTRDRKKRATASTRAVSGLERKYQEMLGEIKKLESAEYEWVGVDGFKQAENYWRDRLTSLRSTLVALERSIRMFDPKWAAKSSMVPKMTMHGRPLLPRGVFHSALVKVLRSASEALLIKDIVARIASALGLPTDRRDQRQRLYAMTYSSLRLNLAKGRVDYVGVPAKWFAV